VSVVLAAVLAGVLNPVLATGPDAIGFNPAQLAGPERPGFACRILDLEAGAENNAFSLAQYNRYTGAFLDEQAKADIVGSVPFAGFRGRGRLAANAAGFGYGCLAASVRTTAEGNVALPKDLFELVLFGNELGRVYRAQPLDGAAQVLFRAGVGGATALGRNLTLGGAAHFVRGLFCAELTEGWAYFLTTPEALVAEGKAEYRTAAGGSGWAFDAGATFRHKEWLMSLGVLDLSPGIRWTEGIEEGCYVLVLDSANAYQLSRGEGLTAGFSRGQAGGFTTFLPVQLNAGVGRRFREWLSGSFTVRSWWRMQPSLSLRVRPAIAAEVWPRYWLATGTTLSFEPGRGVGLGLVAAAVWRRFVVTAGMEDVAGLLMGARGIVLRFSVGYGTAAAGQGTSRPEVLRLKHGVN